MRRAVVALIAAPLALTGCAGDDCDADTQTLATCGGDMLDENTWESGPLDGTYLDFHGQRTWVMNPSGWVGDREPATFDVYLSLNPVPNSDGGAGFADPAGNLAQITAVPSGGGYQIQVLNNTCAQYYLRVVVTYAGTATKAGTCSSAGSGS